MLAFPIHDGLDELARRIDAGDVQIVADLATVPAAAIDTTLDLESLQGLARFCEAEQRHREAARVRRWLGQG